MMTANDIHSAIGTICKSSSRAKISEISGSISRTNAVVFSQGRKPCLMPSSASHAAAKIKITMS